MSLGSHALTAAVTAGGLGVAGVRSYRAYRRATATTDSHAREYPAWWREREKRMRTEFATEHLGRV